MVAKYDDRTKRLDMPLPNADNFLQDDVARLIETINDLDGQVATLDAKGKLEVSQVPDVVPQLDAKNKLADSMMPDRAVMLDATGKIPVAQLPNEGTTSTMNASSEQQMLALNATVGDICDRLDNGYYYILVDQPASSLSNWRILTRTAVTSINGEMGAVTGYVKLKPIAGAVATALDGINGPLRLMADAADPYDAVTYKQLQTVQSVGAGGASMTGVMNNFIGAVEWFNGSRLSIPPGYIAADGQEESQSDPKTADLYTAVKNDIFVSTDEASWQAAPAGSAAGLISKRAFYVKASATAGKFRVPDLNGAQPGSIQGVFLRGSIPGWTNGPGYLASDQIKDHTHMTYFYVNASRNELPSADALRGGGLIKKTPTGAGPDPADTEFDDYQYAANEKYVAARSTVPYENRTVPAINETAPRAAVGIWIIRANGAFQAANTEFRIMTQDVNIPNAGTQVAGGKVTSTYTAAGVEQIQAQMWAEKSVGEADARLVLSPANVALSKRTWMSFDTQGQIITSGANTESTPVGRVLVDRAHGKNSLDDPGLRTGIWYGGDETATSGGRVKPFNYWMTLQLSEGNGNWAQMFFPLGVDAAPRFRYRINSTPKITDYRTFTLDPVSDRRIKKDVMDFDGKQSLANIEALEFKTFRFIEAPEVLRRGIIAQQAETVDAEYVHHNPEPNATKELDTNVLLLDALAAIKVLAGRVKQLEAKLGS
ncbi:tail fiber domain-containing protein [Salmonella enterica subsp. enterica serovar Enteritidis]|nr:tail fiber domain-containing protein [Salmonella enterica subsp. enterica serovar Enteritidis]